MIVSILIGLKTDKNDLSQLKKAFLQMDTDNDGNLTLDEILEAEKQVSGLKLGNKWKEVLYQCDLDGNGKIDFQEFLTAAINHQKILTEENIKYVFETFDTNNDGTIEISEFRSAMPSNFKKTMYMKQNIAGQGSQQVSRKETKESAITDDETNYEDQKAQFEIEK
jgi:calcium-dependent protein kinase